jgi:hypothetical protein
MNICKECVFYREDDEFSNMEDREYFAKCSHPKTTKVDKVNGKETMGYCRLSRKYYGWFMTDCGPKGRWFETKEMNS